MSEILKQIRKELQNELRAEFTDELSKLNHQLSDIEDALEQINDNTACRSEIVNVYYGKIAPQMQKIEEKLGISYFDGIPTKCSKCGKKIHSEEPISCLLSYGSYHEIVCLHCG